MPQDIFNYMKETSRKSDHYTLKLLDDLRSEGVDIHEYTNHLPYLRNRLVNGNLAIPKSRNSLGRLVYESFTKENWEKIIPALSFIELSTVATYVLDDIIDNQPERQNDEATWKKYGINKGIIASGLQTFTSLKTLDKLEISDSDKVEVGNLANNMWLKLWIGEGFNEEMKENTTLEDYITRCYNLCGVMFDTISQISAICAEANEDYIKLVSDIGKNYGIAVMIRNDLADLLPKIRKHSKALSKRSYEDLKKGIWTYPIIHATQHCNEKDKKLIITILGKDVNEEKYNNLYNLLKNSNSIDAILDLITNYKDLCNESIMRLSNSKTRDLLLDLTDLLENLKGYT